MNIYATPCRCQIHPCLFESNQKAIEREGECIMVTDEILCAVQGMIELFPTPEARNAGKAIWNMLADFEEEDWYETVNSGTVQKWLQHYIEN